MNTKKRLVGHVFLLLAVLMAGISAMQTYQHVQDTSYRLPLLQIEENSTQYKTETHANYHAFREFVFACMALILLLYFNFEPNLRELRKIWLARVVIAAGFILGWWLAWPLFQLRAPHQLAETVHLLVTILLVVHLALSRP